MNQFFSAEIMQDLSRGSIFNLFGELDQRIVRNALKTLDETEFKIIHLRFWNNNTISEIAEIMDLRWEEVENILKGTLSKLKTACLSNPEFSRSKKSKCQERRTA